MARRRREQVQCTQCSWVGITGRGKLRLGIFVVTMATVATMIALELAELIALGDQVWPLALTILVLSIGVRLLIRGDRCPECGAAAWIGK